MRMAALRFASSRPVLQGSARCDQCSPSWRIGRSRAVEGCAGAHLRGRGWRCLQEKRGEGRTCTGWMLPGLRRALRYEMLGWGQVRPVEWLFP